MIDALRNQLTLFLTWPAAAQLAATAVAARRNIEAAPSAAQNIFI